MQCKVDVLFNLYIVYTLLHVQQQYMFVLTRIENRHTTTASKDEYG